MNNGFRCCDNTVTIIVAARHSAYVYSGRSVCGCMPASPIPNTIITSSRSTVLVTLCKRFESVHMDSRRRKKVAVDSADSSISLYVSVPLSISTRSLTGLTSLPSTGIF